MAPLRFDQFPNISQKYGKNRLADFIELMCIENQDKEINLNEAMQMYNQETSIYKEDILDEMSDSEMDSSKYIVFVEIFEYIKYRSSVLGEFYPFEYVDKHTIKLSLLSSKNLLYIYLLFSSNTGCFDKSISYQLTNSFEHFSRTIMSFMYPNFKNELFGTGTVHGDYFHGGTRRERLIRLSKCLNTDITQNEENNPHNDESGGDRGIDLVSFFRPDFDICNVPFIPVCLGQCSCSYDDWDNKQYSILNVRFRKFFENVAICHEIIFVPFSLRGIDGKWEENIISEIDTIIIDRFRLFSIIKLNDPHSVITDDIQACIKCTLEKLDVEMP
jgi:hypothetical protein